MNREMDENYATSSALHVVKNQVLDTNDKVDMMLYSMMREGVVKHRPKKNHEDMDSVSFSHGSMKEPESAEEAKFMLDKFNSKARKYDFGDRNKYRNDPKDSYKEKWLTTLKEAIYASSLDIRPLSAEDRLKIRASFVGLAEEEEKFVDDFSVKPDELRVRFEQNYMKDHYI